MVARLRSVQEGLEDADLKLTSVLTDIMGMSGRAILRALIQGERNPQKLAGLALGKAKRKHAELAEALDGHFHEHHAFLVSLHLRQVEELEVSLAQIEARVGDLLAPLAEQVRLLCTIPGIGPASATVILAEIGQDMSRFPTVGHLVSWAGLCPEMHESAGKRRSTRVRKGDLGAGFFDRLDTTKATANLVRRLRALGYDVQITPAA